MNTKRIVLTIIAFILLLSGCSTHSESDENTKENKTPPIPDKVFKSTKNNENIKDSEMKKNIQTYLDTFDSLYKNTNKLRDKDDLSKKESEKLDKLTKLTLENDKNYSDFIKNNDIPEDYKSGAFKIKNYTSSLNNLLKKLNDQIQNLEKNSENDDFSMSDVKDIEETNSKYKEKVNGKKQKEIESFLKEKNIETKAFK